jgi:hypothetical protein
MAVYVHFIVIRSIGHLAKQIYSRTRRSYTRLLLSSNAPVTAATLRPAAGRGLCLMRVYVDKGIDSL